MDFKKIEELINNAQVTAESLEDILLEIDELANVAVDGDVVLPDHDRQRQQMVHRQQTENERTIVMSYEDNRHNELPRFKVRLSEPLHCDCGRQVRVDGFAKKATVELTTRGDVLELRSGRASYKLPTLSLLDLPAIPALNQELGRLEATIVIAAA